MLLPGGTEHLFAWLAAAKLGAIAAPIHTDLAPGEVRALLDHLDPSAIVYDRSLAPKLSGSTERLAAIAVIIEAGGPGGGARPSGSDHIGGSAFEASDGGGGESSGAP